MIITESIKRHLSQPSKNVIISFSCFVLVFGLSHSSLAQTGGDPKSGSKIKVPPKKQVLIETKDRVEIQADWFGGDGGKAALPIILVHDWNSERSALIPLAEYLQTEHGYAVIVPDLRGHGESLNVKGMTEELQRDRFRKAEIVSMVADIDACRKFLEEKNDEGELNLDMLVVIAFGKMNLHAAGWCIEDWSWPPVAGIKQGQNVKALIMISPVKRFKGLQSSEITKNPLFASNTASLPTLIVWGAKHPMAKDSESILNAMQKGRSEPKYDDPDEQWEKQRLFWITYDSAESSEALLKEQQAGLFKSIALFIDKKVLAQKSQLPWQKRTVD